MYSVTGLILDLLLVLVCQLPQASLLLTLVSWSKEFTAIMALDIIPRMPMASNQ